MLGRLTQVFESWIQWALHRADPNSSAVRRSGRTSPVGITAARASQWHDRFLAAGQAGLKSRATEAGDDDHRRLQAKIGELLMETELLYAKVDQLEAGRFSAYSGGS